MKPIAPYYIIIKHSNPALLSFSRVRVIINKESIFPLQNDQTIVIPLTDAHPRIVATDGFHFTKPIQLNYTGPGYYMFQVCCAIEDLELLGGGFLLAFFYLTGFFTGFLVLKILSFVPILYFLYRYYVNRKDFIRIRSTR